MLLSIFLNYNMPGKEVKLSRSRLESSKYIGFRYNGRIQLAINLVLPSFDLDRSYIYTSIGSYSILPFLVLPSSYTRYLALAN